MKVNITIDGKTIAAHEGQTIGGALTAHGVHALRRTAQRDEPRGLYCVMGMCHDCLVTVNGCANQRACRTQVEDGQQITRQQGLAASQDDPVPATIRSHAAPLTVIGGGPAGLSAAIAAAKCGAQVLVIDDNAQPGGQIYRQPGVVDTDGLALFKRVEEFSDQITIWNDASVWAMFEPRTLAVTQRDTLTLVDAQAIIAATGAYDRPVPVPGWTLPGVYTCGGAQVLIKSQRVAPGSRALLAGTGPLQLVVANQMLDAGMEVAAVVEASLMRGTWRHLPDLLSQPALLARGMRYLRRLRRAGVPILRGCTLQSIAGQQQVEGATIVDNSGHAQSFDVDTVCIGYGFVPNTAMTHMLGCEHLCGAAIHDEAMRTSDPQTFVAGDCGGVAGVLVAKAQGAIAGCFAAGAGAEAAPYQRQLVSLSRFRRAMDQIYPVTNDVYSHMTDDTIVCRCEEVTAGEIRDAIRAGTADANDIKKRTRAGMGYCQGCNCLPPIAAMLEREFGVDPTTMRGLTGRPPVQPVALHVLGAVQDC